MMSSGLRKHLYLLCYVGSIGIRIGIRISDSQCLKEAEGGPKFVCTLHVNRLLF